MQSVKEELIEKIDEMPNDMMRQVLDFIERMESSKELKEPDGPECIRIRSKEDFLKKAKKGIEDIKQGRVYSLDETLRKMRGVWQNRLRNLS